jgi:hypothetical protein
MQEHILHIKLMNQPGARDDQGEHGVDRDQLDHRAEGLIVVDARSLGEAVKYPASLVPLQGTIRVELVFENPFSSGNIGANRVRDKIPGVVGDQGSKLFFHGAVPAWINEGSVDGGGHR